MEKPSLHKQQTAYKNFLLGCTPSAAQENIGQGNEHLSGEMQAFAFLLIVAETRVAWARNTLENDNTMNSLLRHEEYTVLMPKFEAQIKNAEICKFDNWQMCL